MKVGDIIKWNTTPYLYKIVGEEGDNFLLEKTKDGVILFLQGAFPWKKDYCRRSARVVDEKPRYAKNLPSWF